jgi:phosphopantothenoylcysteine decarboxylase/phosphopantothenate--cysteine ligase
MFYGRRILVGITGSIAAYKSATLVRLLRKEGAQVQVILTPAAADFITPLTLATLSGNPVHSNYVQNVETGEWTNHVELGLWADLLLIAPATANTISDLVTGRAEGLLGGVFLSARCPVMIAPAMDLDMYAHPATQSNLQLLSSRGVTVLPSPDGELASGLSGAGRMMEPEDIVLALNDFFHGQRPLSGKNVLITAGPTYESIDPVRFIGNRSSGKMGFALAEQAAALGAIVTLVTGPVALATPKGSIRRIDVESAEQMFQAVDQAFDQADICIMSAAVADFKPAHPASQKIKKRDGVEAIALAPTVDILKAMGERKRPGQMLVGFALETQNGEQQARMKLKEKNADLIVLNQPGDDTGFGADTNRVTLITENKIVPLKLMSKTDVAKEILRCVQD